MSIELEIIGQQGGILKISSKCNKIEIIYPEAFSELETENMMNCIDILFLLTISHGMSLKYTF